MEKHQVVNVIVDVLKEVQKCSGREPVEIGGKTCPIGDLPEFDSLNGVEATVELCERLGVDLPGVNAFVDDKGTRVLRVTEIADIICSGALTTES